MERRPWWRGAGDIDVAGTSPYALGMGNDSG